MKVPFCKTTLGEEEKKAVSDVIDSGWVVMGKKTQEFEEMFADYVGSKFAVFVDSGTAALFLSVQYLLHVSEYWKRPSKKVAVPSLTFTSTAEVVVNSGLIPDFRDMETEKPWNMIVGDDFDMRIPVHLMGNKSENPSAIYDSAHRIEKGDGKDIIGFSCYSFYATKNMTTVQGGMIATNSETAMGWLRKARDHGLSHGTLERYEKSSFDYSVDFVGWRFKADDLRAVIGIEQLKKLPENTEKRNIVVNAYNHLFGLENKGNHIYPLLVENRPKFIEIMSNAGIQVSVHFLPLHKMQAYKGFAAGIQLPNTDYLGERLVSLPLYPQLAEDLKTVEWIAEMARKTNLVIGV